MSSETITALITTLAALGGTVIGGFISYLTGVKLKTKEWKLSVLTDELKNLTTLYSEFLVEAHNLVLISVQEKYGDLSKFNTLNRFYAQIELLSESKVVEEAKSIVDHVITCHSASNKKEKKSFYELKNSFIQEVRNEKRKLESS